MCLVDRMVYYSWNDQSREHSFLYIIQGYSLTTLYSSARLLLASCSTYLPPNKMQLYETMTLHKSISFSNIFICGNKTKDNDLDRSKKRLQL
jgi:hypothetical protein